MNIKHLLLAAALCGATVGCTDEEPGKDSTYQGKAGEIQLVFSGSGESVEYPTKAIASAKENSIDRLDVFIFCAESMSPDAKDWHYLETWSTEQTATNKIQLQDAGTIKKTNIKPNELAGYPFLTLYCVANLPEGKIYKTDGTDADALKQPTFDADGTMTDGGTLASDFIAGYNAMLLDASDPGAEAVTTPLLMEGSNTTKISGSASVVSIELKRLVVRFDIDNTAAQSRFTIEKISIANARNNTPLFGAALPLFTGTDRDKLITYKSNDFTLLPGANKGMTESALYAYPNMPEDSTYLILEGKFLNDENVLVPATYPIHITRTDYTDPTKPTTEYIRLMPNNRYKLHISDVTSSSMGGYFEIDSWWNTGTVIDKPQNNAPEFLGNKSLGTVNAGEEAMLPTFPDPTDPTVMRVNEDDGRFNMMVLASGEVELEMSLSTKAGGMWLQDSALVYRSDTVAGKIATIISFKYENAGGQPPMELILRNKAADYDPALWTRLTIYGPLVAPELSDAGGHSTGNSIEMNKAQSGGTTLNVANMFNVLGSQVFVNARSIEGVDYGKYDGFVIKPVEENGYTTKYAIQITDTVDARGTVTTDPKIVFKNVLSTDAATDTVISINLLDPAIRFEKTVDASNAAVIKNDTIEVDTDQLSTGSFTIKVSSALSPVLPQTIDCPWLLINKAVDDWASGTHEYVEYTVSAALPAPATFDDFDLVFTNPLKNAPGLTITFTKKPDPVTPAPSPAP